MSSLLFSSSGYFLMSKYVSTAAIAAALGSAIFAAPAFADEGPQADVIIVTAPPVTSTVQVQDAEREITSAPDGAAFVAKVPGAALVANGPLSGQVQMHGLFGERILLRINGQRFASGGPNAMDPAMHYAPAALIDRIEVARGISPVRDGPGLGGGVNTMLKQVSFSDSGQLSPQMDVSAQYRSADDSVAAGGVAGLANEKLRFGVIGSWEEGSNVRSPIGKIAGTSHRRGLVGVQAGMRMGTSELSLEYRRQETGVSGNPAFAMDIIYFHTDFAQVGFKGELADGVKLEANARYSGVSHRMNNLTLRTTAMPRVSDTYADTMGADLALVLGSASRHVRIGADFEQIDKGYVTYNPNVVTNYVHPLDHAGSNRVGGFIEWRTGTGPVEAELGVRVDRHGAKTGAPRYGNGFLSGESDISTAQLNLITDFTAADRDWSGTTVDASMRMWAELGEFTPRMTLARKTRAPSLVERFAWLPTEASGGLADGNIYVGSVDLKPETAWIAEFGFDWSNGSAYARPVVYYRRVDNFIQGTPYDDTPETLNTDVEIVSNASKDPTPLRWANTDAEIWGADLAFGTKLVGPLRVDGVASYVRGKRRDIADNLYRIAPANGRVALTWDMPRWSVSVEGQATAKQSKVSTSNSEARTGGHFLVNLSGHWLVREGLRLDVGVENLFDRYYEEHLAGYNRNATSIIGVGKRLPGTGRSAFARLRWAFK